MKCCKNSSVLLFFRDIKDNQSKMKTIPSPCKKHKIHTETGQRDVKWGVHLMHNHCTPINQSKKSSLNQSYVKMVENNRMAQVVS